MGLKMLLQNGNNMDYKYFQTIKYKSFESTVPRWNAGQNRFLTDFFNIINKKAKILDVGCGDGCGLLWFKNNFYYNVYGCDIDFEKVSRAKKAGFPISVIDMHNIPFTNNKFDVIYASHVLEHAHDPITVIYEFHRILKSEGILIIVVPFPDNGPDECHCGKYIIRTDPIAVTHLGNRGILNFFESNFIISESKTDNYREPEIWLRFKKRSI